MMGLTGETVVETHRRLCSSGQLDTRERRREQNGSGFVVDADVMEAAGKGDTSIQHTLQLFHGE